jgi:hypothetical protein
MLQSPRYPPGDNITSVPAAPISYVKKKAGEPLTRRRPRTRPEEIPFKEESKVTDSPHIGDVSPEYVAYRLLLDIARVEKKALTASASCQMADRKWILGTYAECLLTVRSPRWTDDRRPVAESQHA